MPYIRPNIVAGVTRANKAFWENVLDGIAERMTKTEADAAYAPIGSTGATTVEALTDASTVGKAVVKAADAAAVRSAADAERAREHVVRISTADSGTADAKIAAAVAAAKAVEGVAEGQIPAERKLPSQNFGLIKLPVALAQGMQGHWNNQINLPVSQPRIVESPDQKLPKNLRQPQFAAVFQPV